MPEHQFGPASNSRWCPSTPCATQGSTCLERKMKFVGTERQDLSRCCHVAPVLRGHHCEAALARIDAVRQTPARNAERIRICLRGQPAGLAKPARSQVASPRKRGIGTAKKKALSVSAKRLYFTTVDREWLKLAAMHAGLRICRVEPPSVRGFQSQIHLERAGSDGAKHVAFPER